jgi:hypothetical protein
MSMLIVFGVQQSWSEELEVMMNKHPFGMDCLIVYKDGKNEWRRNCTEFHHKFGRSMTGIGFDSAFESDIHSTGGTVAMDKIERIDVIMSERLYDQHR